MMTVQFLTEIALIIRGEHPAWGGDRTLAAEGFIARVCADFTTSKEILEDIEQNPDPASEVSGLSPNCIRWIVNRMKEHLPNEHATS